MNRGMSLEEDIRRMKDEVYFLRVEKVVLVEDSSDKPFWKYTLDKFVEGRYEFFPFVNYPTYNTTGKSALMKYYSPYADADFIICRDSDYDYLLKNPDISQPFIFQTYTYSFENYHCFSQGLKGVFQKTVNTDGVNFDFEWFLKEYSICIYELLIQSLWVASRQSENVIEIKKKLGRDIMLPKYFKSKSIEEILSDFKAHIEHILNNNIQPTDDFRNRIIALGLTPENAYLFARGKNVYSNIVVLFDNLKESFKNEIKKKTENCEMIIKEFKNSDESLKKNFNFSDCFLFKKLEQDLNNAFK